MIRPDYLMGTKNEAFGPGGIQNAVVETLVRTEGPIDAKLIDKSINENGTYSASAEGADGFKKVVVDVPNTYLLSDEGKVVNGGSLVTQTSSTITENGVVDTTLIDSVTVDVSGSGGGNATLETTDTEFDYVNDYQSLLTSIEIPDGITSIGEGAFSGCEALTSILIPNSVTGIRGGAFQYCPNLTSISIPNSVTGIGYNAFYSCESLTSIIIPNSVIDIGDYAFQQCYALTSVTIGNSVTNIGEYAFADCTALSVIEFLPTTPPEIQNDNTFDSLPTECIIYVPNGTLSAYTSASNYPDPSTYTYIERPA